MAQIRRSAVRGRIAKGESAKSAKSVPRRGPLPPPEHITDPTAPRSVVDYALQRAADVNRLRRGGMLSRDFCDPDPYLLKAAKFHGEDSARNCPACGEKSLKELHYVYGDELGPYAGRIRKSDELRPMCHQFGEFRVYQVEVCLYCGWNYLIKAFSLGDGTPRRAVPSIPSSDLLD